MCRIECGSFTRTITSLFRRDNILSHLMLPSNTGTKMATFSNSTRECKSVPKRNSRDESRRHYRGICEIKCLSHISIADHSGSSPKSFDEPLKQLSEKVGNIQLIELIPGDFFYGHFIPRWHFERPLYRRNNTPERRVNPA